MIRIIFILGMVCGITFGVNAQNRRSQHPNARYNNKSSKVPFIPQNQIMVNAGNVIINEIQVSYYRRIGEQLQPFVSVGVVRPASIHPEKGLEMYMKDYPPFWWLSQGWTVAGGYYWLINPEVRSEYWGFSLFYRNLSFRHERIDYFVDPISGSSDSHPFTLLEDFQRHVYGMKVVYGIHFPKAKPSSIIRGQIWTGLGVRYREDRHYNISGTNHAGSSFQSEYREHDIFPTIQLGLNLGFGW